jgi:hypothetical protein
MPINIPAFPAKKNAIEDEQEHIGFVIGDGYTAPPEEVIGEDGASVNLYSSIAMAWKAIQELSEKISKMEGGKN